jgi:hypothetical protein
MAKAKITDLKSLDREILALRSRKLALEGQLDVNVGKLRKGYGQMVLNSVFSQFNPASNNIWVALIGRLLENDRLKSGLNNLVDAVSNKVGEGVNMATQKLFHKKDRSSGLTSPSKDPD